MTDSPVTDDDADFTPMPLPGKVVSAGEARRLEAVPFQFSDVRTLAARILKRAQQQAEEKLAAARTQIAKMEKEAQDKGYREGLPKGEKAGFAKGEAAGREAAKAELAKELEKAKGDFQGRTQPLTTALEQITAVLNEQRRQLVAQAENDLLLLALDLAKRLVAHELSIDPEAIKPLASEAIGLVTERSSLVARLNPADLAAMEEELPSLRLLFPDLGVVKLEGDAAIERGGLIIATREGEVDMRLATRFAAFEEALLGYSGRLAVAPWSEIEPSRGAEAESPPPSEPEPVLPGAEPADAAEPPTEARRDTEVVPVAKPPEPSPSGAELETWIEDASPAGAPGEGGGGDNQSEIPPKPEPDDGIDDPANNSLRL